MGRQTPLYSRHQAAGARIVDFGGWDMPLHYGSQLDEHHAVRGHAGVFDVSHMTVVDIGGAGAEAFLRRCLANDVAKLTAPGRGLYSCMLNDAGGVIDDLIVYRRGGTSYRLVVNAATRDKDLAWLSRSAEGGSVTLDERAGGVMLAVQGPAARDLAACCLPTGLRDQALELRSFHCCAGEGFFVARTGYTGEDGWEIATEDPQAGQQLWDDLLAAGIQPCGLGARDTLRLEAGLALYGQDLDEQHSPLVSGLEWTVAWTPEDRDFTGRAALQAEQQHGPEQTVVGLILEERGIMRHGQPVFSDAGSGLVTSGGFSPTLQRSIALARVPVPVDEQCTVEIRGVRRSARVVKPAFVRRGKPLVDLNPA